MFNIYECTLKRPLHYWSIHKTQAVDEPAYVTPAGSVGGLASEIILTCLANSKSNIAFARAFRDSDNDKYRKLSNKRPPPHRPPSWTYLTGSSLREGGSFLENWVYSKVKY